MHRRGRQRRLSPTLRDFTVSRFGVLRMPGNRNRLDLRRLAARIVSAYASNNEIPTDQLGPLLFMVRNQLEALTLPPHDAKARSPAVPVEKSIASDHLVCLEDAKRVRLLRRHLRLAHGLTPAQYRERWGLPVDYPMIDPDYARRRSEIAREGNLGYWRLGAGAVTREG
jgi:predicted transcriptional regulator